MIKLKLFRVTGKKHKLFLRQEKRLVMQKTLTTELRKQTITFAGSRLPFFKFY